MRTKTQRLRQLIRLQTSVEGSKRRSKALVRVETYLANNGRAKVFNVVMCNPNNKKRLTYCGSRIGLEILGNVGYLIEKG